jgi:hypothetical protein
VIMGWYRECTGDEEDLDGSDRGDGEKHFVGLAFLFLWLRVAADEDEDLHVTATHSFI